MNSATHFFSCPLLHRTRRDLTDKRAVLAASKSRAVFSTTTPNTLLLFVHGFGGSALTTWDDFYSLLRMEPKCKSSDLFFYGYDGLCTRAQHSAGDLEYFIDTYLADPAEHVNEMLNGFGHREAFTYDHIYIIAHSFGAIVSRRMLLDGIARNRLWTHKCRLVLYAPAHTGADIMALVSEFFSGISVRFSRMARPSLKARFQALHDLEENCQTLVKLHEDTMSVLTQQPSNLSLRALKVLLSNPDRVVSPTRFAEDAPADLPPISATHIKICKAHKMTDDPLTRLVSIL